MTEIYNYYVLNTAITFDTEPFTPEHRQIWLDQFAAESIHQCLVLENHRMILGYASSSTFRPKPAYQQSVETTIYLHPEAAGKGWGKKLYSTLFSNLAQLELNRAYGIIALPNEASIKLHKGLGFEPIGTLTEVGYKFERYHDTLWLEKKLNKST